MRADAIQEMTRLAQAAQEPKVAQIGGPGNVVYVKMGGDLKKLILDPADREHKADDIPSLVDALTKSSPNALGELSASSAKAVIWFDRDGAFGWLDESKRRDSVHIPLGLSPQMNSLISLEKPGKSFQQRDLIRFIKNDLYGCQPGFDLIAAIRNVKFTVNSAVQGTQLQNKASLGRMIESELQGAESLPDFVTFTTPVWDNPRVQFMAAVVCSLDCNLDSGTFELKPVPLSIETAITAAETIFGEQIRRYAESQSLGEDRLLIFAGTQ